MKTKMQFEHTFNCDECGHDVPVTEDRGGERRRYCHRHDVVICSEVACNSAHQTKHGRRR